MLLTWEENVFLSAGKLFMTTETQPENALYFLPSGHSLCVLNTEIGHVAPTGCLLAGFIRSKFKLEAASMFERHA